MVSHEGKRSEMIKDERSTTLHVASGCPWKLWSSDLTWQWKWMRLPFWLSIRSCWEFCYVYFIFGQCFCLLLPPSPLHPSFLSSFLFVVVYCCLNDSISPSPARITGRALISQRLWQITWTSRSSCSTTHLTHLLTHYCWGHLLGGGGKTLHV